MATTTATPTTQSRTNTLKLFRANLQTFALVGALLVIWLFFTLATKNGVYLQAQNFSNLFRQMTITALMSVGMVLVIVTGNIDLSVGKLAGFISVVVAVFQARYWTRSTEIPASEVHNPVFFILGLIAILIIIAVATRWYRQQEAKGSKPSQYGFPLVVVGIIAVTLLALWFVVTPIAADLTGRVLTALVLEGSEALTTTISVIFALLLGIFVGIIQGFIIAYWRVPAFIVTLGGLWVFSGLITLVTEGKTIPANQPLFSGISQDYVPPTLGWMIAAAVVLVLVYSTFTGRQKKVRYGFELPPIAFDLVKTGVMAIVVLGYVYIVNQYNGIPNPVLLLAIVAVVVGYMATNTRFGRYAYAIGGNREAARLSGVNIRRNVFFIFVLMGFLCGVAGTALASYVGYGTIAAGQGYELDVIAACILGGTSTLGGEGTIFGAMIGALIMASLTNGLQMLNVQPGYVYMLKGAVLVAAVLLDVQLKKNR